MIYIHFINFAFIAKGLSQKSPYRKTTKKEEVVEKNMILIRRDLVNIRFIFF
jgi:hypothetical protein